MNYGQAVEALKEGKRLQRIGWNGKGLFVFMQVPAEISVETIPKMQSLPQSVKDEFARRFNSDGNKIKAIFYINQLAIVNEGNVICGWVASVSDSLATDWVILD